ncbi:hypothetical protein FOZ60_015741 [Perkinsus olseni]|uniref:Uncharacterized protein n=1 Tax=Perkinsus olseni TaxID=32597 RepID=A0A7J6P5H2_PEROL|nr:hypothetical protein FOZ60_015741 [Perkinsus olseni]
MITDWEKIADTYLVTIGPSYFEEISTFNTDRFAEEVINNATRAGVDLNTLVMTLNYDLGADPKGNGSVIFAEGRGFYFFSQRRAVSKIELAKKHGLRGIGLLGSDDLLADLYPWDERSLLYGLATNL